MNTAIDGVLKEWGDRLFYKAVKGRKSRNIFGGLRPQKPPALIKGCSVYQKLRLTINKAPEVMVKITGSGKHIQHVKDHLNYISRNGTVEIEDENGDRLIGKDSLGEVADSWEKGYFGIPKEGEEKGLRESFNIMLSMPPGTDREGVKKAAKAFAVERFTGHQYVFAAHNDEKHPHVHLMVKAVDSRGIRLNPRKSDLQQWREHFAEKLRDEGIAANATPRRTRGIVLKGKNQALWHMDRDGRPSYVRESQKTAILQEVKSGKPHINPLKSQIEKARKETVNAYGEILKELVKSGIQEKYLALQLVNFIQKMPVLKTSHQQTVEVVHKQLYSNQTKNISR